MTKDPFLPFTKEVTSIRDELEKLLRRVEEVKAFENSSSKREMQEEDVSLRFCSWVSVSSEDIFKRELCYLYRRINYCTFAMTMLYRRNLTSLISEEVQPPCSGGRRIAVNLLSFVYLYLTRYINRGGSKASSSGSLEFRDIYISILLFQAAYVWIKFRVVIPRGAVYRRPGSNKWEPRITFPVKRGVGGKSKRIPLGSYDSYAEGEVVYRIAAFYCKWDWHHSGDLDLGGGAYFPIPTWRVDPNVPYEEKVKQMRVQVLKVYTTFKERKASGNFPPSGPRRAFEMWTREGHLFPTPPIQQLRQPLNSGMNSTLQGPGSRPLAPDIYNGIDSNNRIDVVRLVSDTLSDLRKATMQIDSLKAQLQSRMEITTMDLIQKIS